MIKIDLYEISPTEWTRIKTITPDRFSNDHLVIHTALGQRKVKRLIAELEPLPLRTDLKIETVNGMEIVSYNTALGAPTKDEIDSVRGEMK